MKYLRVKNWDKLQHPSPKPLPWIKFFTALLSPTKETCYSDWPDHTKTLLHHVWLMARVHANRIPETWLTRERLNLKTKLNLQPLILAGFVWFEDEHGNRIDEILDSSLGKGSESLACASIARSGVLDSSLGSLNQGESEGLFNQALAFEDVWAAYPRQVGRKEAFRHFCASVGSDADLADLRTALAHYAAHLAANSWKQPQNGSTFFNNWRDYIKPIEESNADRNIRSNRGGTSEPPAPPSKPAIRNKFGQRSASDFLPKREVHSVPEGTGEGSNDPVPGV